MLKETIVWLVVKLKFSYSPMGYGIKVSLTCPVYKNFCGFSTEILGVFSIRNLMLYSGKSQEGYKISETTFLKRVLC